MGEGNGVSSVRPVTLNKNHRSIDVYPCGKIVLCPFTSSGRSYKSRELTQHRKHHGYRYVSFGGSGSSKNYHVHRLVAEAFCPEWSNGLNVDHIDGDKSNNSVSNLRMVTGAQNLRSKMMTKKIQGGGSRGVRFREDGRFWEARIQVDRKQYYLGAYPTRHEAEAAFNGAAIVTGYNPEGLSGIHDNANEARAKGWLV